MIKLITILAFIAVVYTFAILTGSLSSVYNATDNQLTANFSKFQPTYQDATTLGNSLR